MYFFRMAVWISSNCGKEGDATGLRLRCFQKMKKAGLRVDAFGNCFRERFPVWSRWDPKYFELIST